MSKASQFIKLYEEVSLDHILSENPELPKRDFHFDFNTILSHAHDFDIVMQKVDTFSTMKHCLDPFPYVVARLNKTDYIENAEVEVEDNQIMVSNDKIKAGFDGDGLLTKVYKNDDNIKITKDARLEDIYIKACSKQVYTILQLTFKTGTGNIQNKDKSFNS